MEYVWDGEKCNMKFLDAVVKDVGFRECDCRPEDSDKQEARRVCGAAARRYEIDEDRQDGDEVRQALKTLLDVQDDVAASSSWLMQRGRSQLCELRNQSTARHPGGRPHKQLQNETCCRLRFRRDWLRCKGISGPSVTKKRIKR